MLQKEENKRLWKVKLKIKSLWNQNHSSRGYKAKNKTWQYLTGMVIKAVNRAGFTWQDDKYSGNADRGIQRLYTHGGGEHRWKQSRIRDEPDWWHKRKCKWPETRGELPFKIKHEFTRQKTQDRTSLTAMWHICKENVYHDSLQFQWFLQLTFFCNGMRGTHTQKKKKKKTLMKFAPNFWSERSMLSSLNFPVVVSVGESNGCIK